MKTKPSLRVGELAKAAGVSADTIRHYERKGVLRSQRGENGYREYSKDAVERVLTIRKALAVGFTLNELNTVFKILDRGEAPCNEVRDLAATKLAALEQHIQEVTALRDDLRDAIRDWDKRLAQTTKGERAELLKNLNARAGRSSTTLFLRTPRTKRKGKNND